MGRPREESELKLIAFRADAATVEALDKLLRAAKDCRAAGVIANGGKSEVIRKAICDAAGKL